MEQNDQRNVLLAIVLMLGVLFLWQIFLVEPQARARQEAARRAQAEQAATTNPETPAVALAPRPRDEVVAEDQAAGLRAPLDAPAMDGSISLRGARIDDVALKNFYETVQDKEEQDRSREVQLFEPDGSLATFYATVNWIGAPGLPAENTVWTQTSEGPLTETNPLRLQYSGQGVRVDRMIAVDANYMFTVTDTLTNTGTAPVNAQPVTVIRQRQLPEHLKPPPQAHAGVIGVYGDLKNQTLKYSELSRGKTVLEAVSAGWIGLTTKYWMAAAIPEQGQPVDMRASVLNANGQSIYQAGYTGSTFTIAPGQSVTQSNRIFAGAKKVEVLDAYQKAGVPAFTDAVDWSWMWFITKPFFWMLQTFQNWFGSFGLAILATTVVVKAVFFPVQMKMYESMSKMRKLLPEQKEIQERFAADRARQQQEIMKLYQREKVNPLAGCLPIIPQIFVFYALYHVLMVTLEMRHTPFYGWVQDMSARDPTTIFNLFGLLPYNPAALPSWIGWLFDGPLHIGLWPILYGLTMWALQGMSPPPTDPIQKAIMRFLPLIFLLLFAGVAAGLAIYWTWSNLITMVQQYYIMRKNGVETEFDKFLARRFGKAKPAE
jgi:YidC/Oxa1 family membrane protein insertase